MSETTSSAATLVLKALDIRVGPFTVSPRGTIHLIRQRYVKRTLNLTKCGRKVRYRQWKRYVGFSSAKPFCRKCFP